MSKKRDMVNCHSIGFDPDLLICMIIILLPIRSRAYSYFQGLRYEDIINESQREVVEALELAPSDVVAGRTRRLKRAVDLSLKRKNFLDYAPGVDQETFKAEIYDDIEKIRARDQEYALLNAHNK
jgi:ubiquinol-cytochrome c reductase subunit 7